MTRAQLTALGYTDRMVEGALRAGRLQAWHRDVFAVGDGDLSPHGLCMAAVLFRGDGTLVSHQSAVWLWGLEKKLEIPVHVSVRWRGHSEDAVGLHHSPTLRGEDIARTERLPVTAVPRTLLDHASEAKMLRLERAIDQADRLGLLDLAAIERITAEAHGHRGRGPLLRAMTIYREKGLTRSGAEKRMLAALADVGVRRPTVDSMVAGYELDFFWERERFAVELDRWEDHHSRRSAEEDRDRRERLSRAGIEAIRITRTRLRREPRKVAMRIAAHLDRRRRDRAA